MNVTFIPVRHQMKSASRSLIAAFSQLLLSMFINSCTKIRPLLDEIVEMPLVLIFNDLEEVVVKAKNI